MSIIEDLNNGIKEAIRSQNQIRLNTLRMLKSKILAVDARANLPDAKVLELFKSYYKSLQEAKEQAASRPEMVAQLEKELEIIQEFLPKALTREETQQIVEKAIADSGAKTKRDLGLVMKSAKSLNSAIDGKLAKELAEQLLND